MENDVKEIVKSKKSKYLKYISIIYIAIGIIFFIWDLVNTFQEENIYYLIEGIIVLSVTIYIAIINTVLYESHLMNKFIILSLVKINKNNNKNIEDKKELSSKEDEDYNNQILNKIIEKYEK